ncbi:MAG: c-type cytochrome [Ignavibacteriae bacterium]|nr:c-type cytochrome [Ignavibacteriota bacterium]
MKILEKRRSIPVEIRSYGLIYVCAAGLLAFSTVWAVIDETWVRRPWKKHQKEFHQLELAKAEQGLHGAEEEFHTPEVQGRYAAVELELRIAEAALQNEEYWQAASELGKVQLHLSELSQQLQFTRSESDEVYYLYKTAVHKKKPADKEKLRLDRLEQEKATLEREIALVQKKRHSLEVKVRAVGERVEKLKDSLMAMRADIAAWQRKVEAVKKRAIEVKQVVLENFDYDNFGGRIARVERCMTCHLGIDQQGFENEKQPFTRHSYIIDYHPVEKFGCTPCHGGQGVALTARAAHGAAEFWPNPLLGEGVRERLCGKCHQAVDFPEAPTLTDGRKLFESSGCLGCHNVEGYVKVPNIGPPLNHIAVKVKPSWLLKWILNPKEYLPRTKMPNFHFTEEEARAIRAYLLEKSLTQRSPSQPSFRIATQEMIEKGKELFGYARCVSCHSLDGTGGTLAPDLIKVAQKVRPEWLFAWIKNPRAYQPNTKMPQYRFTDKEIQLIVSYLLSLTETTDTDEQMVLVRSSDEVKRGEKLVIDYGCLGCHDPVGQEAVGGKVGADLTFFGDKPIENFDFGDVIDIPRMKEAWVVTKLQNPRIFSTERIQLKMPDFSFNLREAQSLSTILLGFTEEHPPEPFVRSRQPESNYTPPGEFGRLVSELNCLTCHKINSRGGTLAPDLSYEGSRANAEWLKEFFRNPTTLRPTLVERMPKFNLPEQEIDIIANYMKTVLINNDIASDFLKDVKISKEDTEKGRKLYYEKYRCQSCHQINYEGGTMGPELVSTDMNIRERRTAGWIFRWIKNPQALDPAALEPVLNLSDEEALLITKYLLSY